MANNFGYVIDTWLNPTSFTPESDVDLPSESVPNQAPTIREILKTSIVNHDFSSELYRSGNYFQPDSIEDFDDYFDNDMDMVDFSNMVSESEELSLDLGGNQNNYFIENENVNSEQAESQSESTSAKTK